MERGRQLKPHNGLFSLRLWYPGLCCLIVLISTVLQFGALENGLVSDDNMLVSSFADRGCGPNVVDCFRGQLFHFYYRPVLPATFALVQQFHLHNNDPEWFHLENLALHAIVVALGLKMFRLLFRRRKPALLAGTLFALHPVHVTITAFIGGRTDTLALLFLFVFVIGVRIYYILYYVNRHCVRQTTRRRRMAGVWFAIAFLALLAALFTKEQVAGVALLCPLFCAPLQHRNTNRNGTRRIHGRYGSETPAKFDRRLMAFGVPLIIYGLAGAWVMRANRLQPSGWSLPLHIEIIGRTLNYSAHIFLLPTVTTLHTSSVGSWLEPHFRECAVGYLFGIALIALLIKFRKDTPCLICILWTILTLLPCINIVPMQTEFVSPYRAAIPLVGVAGLVGNLLSPKSPVLSTNWHQIFRTIPALITLIVLVHFMLVTLEDVPNWNSELSLRQVNVAADPNFLPDRYSLANCYLTTPNRQPDYIAALNQYNICIDQLFGNNTSVNKYAALANSQWMKYRLRSASGLTQSTEDILPRLLRERGSVLWMLGRYEQANVDYNITRQISLTSDDSNRSLATEYRKSGEQLERAHNIEKAVECYRSGLTLNPVDQVMRTRLASIKTK